MQKGSFFFFWEKRLGRRWTGTFLRGMIWVGVYSPTGGFCIFTASQFTLSPASSAFVLYD